MTQGEAQDLVNGAALVVAGIYFYRKLIEPAGGTVAAGTVPTGASPPAGFSLERITFRGAAGSWEGAEPDTIPGAAAQLMGKGKIAPTERFVVGWGVVFLTLSLAAPLSPQLAGSFAALVALGSILGNGVQVSKDVQAQLHSKATNTTPAAGNELSPTTLVSFAGAAAPVMPSAAKPEKKSRKRKPFTVEST